MKSKDINILAIESSCDETAAAVVRNEREILSSVIHTQIPIHTLYGGVVPEIASRNHLEKIDSVITEACSNANLKLNDMDAIAVTSGPGLVGALLVGVSEAKAIAYALNKPLIGVNHIDGHISAIYIENDIKPPFICLVVSGGHTSLIKVKDYGEYELLSQTADDACGEAFDKAARAIGLGYPGGPKIEQVAKEGNPNAYPLPRPKNKTNNDFSFSGLKTAVLNTINSLKMQGKEVDVNDMAASFQSAAIDSLLLHTIGELEKQSIKKFALCGGVAANLAIKSAFKNACEKIGVEFFTPSPKYCTDNAAMIGIAAYRMFQNNKFSKYDLNAKANLSFTEGE